MSNMTIGQNIEAYGKGYLAELIEQVSLEDFIPPSVKDKNIYLSQFKKNVALQVHKNPKLKNCTPVSLIQTLSDCARMGVLPDGRQGYLVPFKTECTFILSYMGMIDIARRFGYAINATIKYENDEWIELEDGEALKMRFKPNLEKDRGEAQLYISFAKNMETGAVIVGSYMSKKDAKNHRDKYSKDWSYKGLKSVWGMHFDEMAKKTVVRKLFKYLSQECAACIEYDFEDKGYDTPASYKDVSPKPEALPEQEPVAEEKFVDLLNHVGEILIDEDGISYEGVPMHVASQKLFEVIDGLSSIEGQKMVEANTWASK